MKKHTACIHFSFDKVFFVVGISVGLLLATVTTTHAAACTNAFQSGSVAEPNYGAAWNTQSSSQELLIQGTECSNGSATVKLGSEASTQYVFKTAYTWNGNKWVSVDLSSTNTLLGNTWYKEAANGSIPLNVNGNTYTVGFICQYTNNAWKCGCKDKACTTPYWQLQGISGGNGSGGNGELPAALIPFEQPSLSTLQSSNKLVIAHWHQFPISRNQGSATNDEYTSLQSVSYPDAKTPLRLRPLARPARPESDWKLRDALIDIKWAQNIGVDAFLVNMYYADQKNPYAWPMYITFLQAAKQANTNFKVAPNFSCDAGAGTDGGQLGKNLATYIKNSGELNNPHQLRVNGKFVVGTFHAANCSVSYWQNFKSVMKAEGLDTHLMCVFLGDAYRSDYDGVCDSWSDWGRKDSDIAAGSDYSTRFAGAYGREPIVAAISHGDTRYKAETNAYEQRGSETLRVNWEEAINTGADWAQFVTWNDMGEHSQAYPNTAEQFSLYDLSAYYIAWFKTGKKPAINKDALYYFHRLAAVPPGPTLRRGSWSNLVETVAFLTAPATVEIITSAGTTRKDFGAGMHTLTAPLPSSGKPRFRIVRNGTVITDITSAFTVGAARQPNDIIYRGGGSLRTEYGKKNSPTTICQNSDADTCLMTPGEPVWLAH